jgi:hypothetical protein
MIIILQMLLALLISIPIMNMGAEAGYRSSSRSSYSRSYSRPSYSKSYSRPKYYARPGINRTTVINRGGRSGSGLGDGLSQGIGLGAGMAIANNLLTPHHNQGYYNQPSYTPQPSYRNESSPTVEQQPYADMQEYNRPHTTQKKEGFFQSLWNTFVGWIWFWCFIAITIIGIAIPVGLFFAWTKRETIASKLSVLGIKPRG